MARKLATLQTQTNFVYLPCKYTVQGAANTTTWAQRTATSENTEHAKRTGKQHGKPWTQLAVEFYVEGSSFTACAPFENTSSVGCYSAVPAIICSSLHITSYCCYSYVSCILCSLLVSSEVAASRGHVVVFALPFISYLYHWFLFALLCLHCGERAKVQMIVHMKMCTDLAFVSLPALVHLEKPTYPPDTCWQTAHITV